MNLDETRAELGAATGPDRADVFQRIALLDDPSEMASLLVEFVGRESDEANEWINSALEGIQQPPNAQIDEWVDWLNRSHQKPDRSDQAYWAATMLGLYESLSSRAVTALQLAAQHGSNENVRRRASRVLDRRS